MATNLATKGGLLVAVKPYAPGVEAKGLEPSNLLTASL